MKKNSNQFNLERAKSGAPVCTRDGREAKIITFERKGSNPIVALVKRPEGIEGEDVLTYDENGQCYYNATSDIDLVMVTYAAHKEGWMNIYPTELEDIWHVAEGSYIFQTEEEAKAHAAAFCLATIKVEWEEIV